MRRRDLRALLWFCCAAVCWRWFVGVRAPMPAVGACEDLWLAAQVAGGDLGALADAWWRAPVHALLLTPIVALGGDTVTAAKVLACLAGGLAVLPIGFAAERLREGAGVPAAAIALAGAGAVTAAGAASGVCVSALLVASGTWALVVRHRIAGTLLAIVGGASALQPLEPAFVAHGPVEQVRLVLGAGALALPLVLVSPRSRAFAWPALVFFVVAVSALASSHTRGPFAAGAPALAVLAGVGLARLPARVRELLLCVFVATDVHAAWTLGEDPAAVAERVAPQFVQRHELDAEQRVLSDLARVRWAVGERPLVRIDDLARAAAADDVGAVVLGPQQVRDASLRASLAGRFELASLPVGLQELVDLRGLAVLVRRAR